VTLSPDGTRDNGVHHTVHLADPEVRGMAMKGKMKGCRDVFLGLDFVRGRLKLGFVYLKGEGLRTR